MGDKDTQKTDAPPAAPPPPKVIRHTEILRCNFTKDEILELAQTQQRALRQIERLEDDLASVRADYKSNITRAECEVSDLRRKIVDGYEMRGIECKTVFHSPSVGIKTTVRLDMEGDDAIVKSMRMAPYECQENLPLEDPPADPAPEPEAAPPPEDSEVPTLEPGQVGTPPLEEAGQPNLVMGPGPAPEPELAKKAKDTVLAKHAVNKPSHGATLVLLQNRAGQRLITLQTRLLDQVTEWDAVPVQPADVSDGDAIFGALASIIDHCRNLVASGPAPLVARAAAELASWAIKHQEKVS
jgi:hypothetical protein